MKKLLLAFLLIAPLAACGIEGRDCERGHYETHTVMVPKSTSYGEFGPSVGDFRMVQRQVFVCDRYAEETP